MADEKTVVKGQEEKQNFFTKLINFFKKLPGAIARPFKNMWHELRKVTWPSRPDVIKYSLIVLVFLVFMGVIIALLDTGSFELVKVITPPDKAAEEARNQLMAEIQKVLDTLPEGSYFDEASGQIILADGYTYDAYGNVITNEQAEQLKDYPAGSYFGEDGTVILPDGYDYDENGQVIEVQPEESSDEELLEEANEEENVEEEAPAENGEVSSENE